MKLYEIDEAILNCIDTETGEVIDVEKLDALQMERDEKIEKVLLWIKDLKAEEKAVADEERAMRERRTHCKNKIASLENFAKYALNGEKFKTPKVSVSYRKTDSVAIDDILEIPADFLKYAEPTANKTEIKKALKNGIEIAGCHLEKNESMIIK